MEEIKPTIEEPKVETQVETPEENLSEEAQLLAALKEAGMTKPEQVDGAIRNANKTFQMQSERDQLANQLKDMEKRMAEMETKPTDTGEYGEAVDLQGEIRKAFKAERAEERRQNALVQEQQMKSWNTIQSDADFKLIESIWNEKLKDPNFIYGVQSGQVDPVMEYHSVKSEYFKGLMKSAVGTIETLQGGGAPKVHVESGDARTPAMEPDGDESEQAKIIKELGDKADSGKILSEDDELRLIQASLSKT